MRRLSSSSIAGPLTLIEQELVCFRPVDCFLLFFSIKNRSWLHLDFNADKSIYFFWPFVKLRVGVQATEEFLVQLNVRVFPREIFVKLHNYPPGSEYILLYIFVTSSNKAAAGIANDTVAAN